MALIEANFFDNAIAFDANGYRALLRRAGKEHIAGGQTYAALIAAYARKAKAAILLTFNARHFMQLEAAGARVIVRGTQSRDKAVFKRFLHYR